jgi:hypothetical protein
VDSHGQSLAYVYGHADKRDAETAKGLTLDEARRIASNIAHEGSQTMFFTRLGYVVVGLALIAGIWNVAGGLMIATGVIGPHEEALARIFPSASTSGEVIDKGIYRIIFGIVLGILTEISSALRAQSKSRG